jgi:hypothetical protein
VDKPLSLAVTIVETGFVADYDSIVSDEAGVTGTFGAALAIALASPISISHWPVWHAEPYSIPRFKLNATIFASAQPTETPIRPVPGTP